MEAVAVLIIAFLVLYFLPFLIALMRARPNTVAILVLNLFLGWTLIGWVVALVWAMSTNETAAALQTQAKQQLQGRRRERQCPHCAETILVEARICKHCRQPVAASA